MNSDGVSLVRNGFASMVTLPSTPGPTPLLARLVTLLASQLVVRRSRTGQFRPFACTLEIHSLLRFKHRAVANRLRLCFPPEASVRRATLSRRGCSKTNSRGQARTICNLGIFSPRVAGAAMVDVIA